MKQSFPKINIRDGTAGFLGWVILGNLGFLLLLSFYFKSRTSAVHINGDAISYIISFFTLIAISISFLKKRMAMSIGIALAVMVNLGLWAAFLGVGTSSNFTEMIFFIGIPLPSGFVIGILH